MASAFLAFGLYNVHSVSGVTEGGILGMSLLLQHWLDISPSISGFVMNSICYAMGWKVLGKMFIFYSVLSTIGFSVSYRIFEQFEPLWPNLYEYPLIACLICSWCFVCWYRGRCMRQDRGRTERRRCTLNEHFPCYRFKNSVDLSDQRSDRACLVYKLYSDSKNRFLSSDCYYFRTDYRDDKWGQVP